jgi:hypothetical protein
MRSEALLKSLFFFHGLLHSSYDFLIEPFARHHLKERKYRVCGTAVPKLLRVGSENYRAMKL